MQLSRSGVIEVSALGVVFGRKCGFSVDRALGAAKFTASCLRGRPNELGEETIRRERSATDLDRAELHSANAAVYPTPCSADVDVFSTCERRERVSFLGK